MQRSEDALMQAVVCRALGPPEALVVTDVPEPVAGAGEALIDVHAAGLNFPDALLVQGLYQIRPPLPFTPGVEAAGVVRAVGDGVRDLRPGDRVIAPTNGGGAFAERAVVNAALAVTLPPAVDMLTGAGLMTTYGTAYHALADRARLRPGEWVFVTGAGGGVGTAATALAKALGAHVVAAATSGAKRDAARDAGADVVLDAAASDLADTLKRTGDGGVDVVVDNVGGAQFDAALRGARREARILIVGFTSATIPQIPANRILLKELDVRGIFWGAWAARNPQRNRDNLAAVFELIARGTLQPRVAATYALADAPDAIRDLMERRIVGKAAIVMPACERR
ncbi:MAG: NADPH:quinone oxidoreductase family protein [Candidatus Velthaea sp.]